MLYSKNGNSFDDLILSNIDWQNLTAYLIGLRKQGLNDSEVINTLPIRIRNVVEEILEIIGTCFKEKKLHDLVECTVEWYNAASAMFSMCFCKYDNRLVSGTIAGMAYYLIYKEIDYAGEDNESTHLLRLHILNYATDWIEYSVRKAYDRTAPKCVAPLRFERDDAFNFLMMSECYKLENSKCTESWFLALRERCNEIKEHYPNWNRNEIKEKGQWVAGWLFDEMWLMYHNM